jgi:hypothetical protein
MDMMQMMMGMMMQTMMDHHGSMEAMHHPGATGKR